MSLIAISTLNPILLLATAAIGGLFSGLHSVSEPAFMAGAYLVGTLLFWRFFQGKEKQLALVLAPAADAGS